MTDDTPWSRPSVFEFVETETADSDANVVYDTETRLLCGACEQAMLAWIDDEDSIDPTERTGFPTVIESASAIRRTARHLDEVAHNLETELDADDRD
jgi:hypothetical protein